MSTEKDVLKYMEEKHSPTAKNAENAQLRKERDEANQKVVILTAEKSQLQDNIVELKALYNKVAQDIKARGRDFGAHCEQKYGPEVVAQWQAEARAEANNSAGADNADETEKKTTVADPKDQRVPSRVKEALQAVAEVGANVCFGYISKAEAARDQAINELAEAKKKITALETENGVLKRKYDDTISKKAPIGITDL